MKGFQKSVKFIYKNFKLPIKFTEIGRNFFESGTKLFPHPQHSVEDVEITKIVRKIKSSCYRGKWIFKVVAGNDRGCEYIGVSNEIKVGRHPHNSILLRDPKVSRFHAAFYCKGEQLYLEDLKSTNGSKVNGELVTKKQVFAGDEVKFGETVILITYRNN